MRVAWDLEAITGPRPTGLGVSVRLLLDALRKHAPEIEVIELRPNELDRPLIGVPDRLRWEQWLLPAALRREQARGPVDLLYSPALGAPLASPVPVVAHVHDLISLHYQQQFSGVAGWYWKRLLPYTWKRCRALTVSNWTVKADIVKLLGYPEERVHVVPYYPEPHFLRAALGQLPNFEQWLEAESPEPLFFTLASHEPRKNLELAIRGYSKFARSYRPGEELHCYGVETPHTKSLKELAARLLPETEIDDMYQGVVFEDYPSREEIVAVMLKATALLFLSRYEGYGMPPLEAMSVGCAVVLSDIPAHRAVYDDAAHWRLCPPDCRERPPFVGVDDADGLADVMGRLVQDSAYRSALRRSGLAYSRTFSPVDTATALAQAFASAAQ